MARATFETWIPEEFDSKVVAKVNATSAVEALSVRIPMKTDTKNVPRDGGVGVDVVDKGAAYGEDTATNDVVTLTARKLGKVVRIAEEDIDDTEGFIDILNTKKVGWASSYAKFLDNAALGTTAAANGTTVPFTSVYKALRTTTGSYTADTNRVAVATATAITYANLSSVLGLVEAGDYFDESRLVVIAHPYFKGTLRGLVDGSSRPIFLETGAGTPDTLFGLPIKWSIGAKATATATSAPGAATNPLLFVVNADYLLLGVRSGPESVVIDGRDGASTLTDETLLKMRARRGFAIGTEFAAAVLDKTL
jgi:HK97 family phage major capsid protein